MTNGAELAECSSERTPDARYEVEWPGSEARCASDGASDDLGRRTIKRIRKQ